MGGEGIESSRGGKTFQSVGVDLGSPKLGLFPHSSWRSAPLTPQHQDRRVTRSLLYPLCLTSLVPPCWL